MNIPPKKENKKRILCLPYHLGARKTVTKSSRTLKIFKNHTDGYLTKSNTRAMSSVWP